jgi:hypothetical protein
MAHRPIVFIPGFPGSELYDTFRSRKVYPPSPTSLIGQGRSAFVRRVAGSDDGIGADGLVASGVIRHSVNVLGIPLDPQAESLYAELERMGYELGGDLLPVPWDWRLPIDHPSTRERVVSAVTSLAEASGSKVVMMVHSTGGLVFRQLIESGDAHAKAILDRLEAVISIGVPWIGTLKSLRGMTVGIGAAAGLVSRRMTRDILRHSWAAYDLLPADPALTDMQVDGSPVVMYRDADGRESTPTVDLSWLGDGTEAMRERARHAHSRLGARAPEIGALTAREIPVYNVVGWGAATDVAAQADAAGKVRFEVSDDGDGTIPTASAARLEGPTVKSYHFPVGAWDGSRHVYHADLWRSSLARRLLAVVLQGSPRTPYVSAVFDIKGLAKRAQSVPIRVVGLDPDGRALENAVVRFGAGALQPARDYRLDGRGRATLKFVKHNQPVSNLYRVPIELTWQHQGTAHREAIQLDFLDQWR